jgi:hypothetical protein
MNFLFLTRNKSKDIPVGLLYLGRLGEIIASPISELISFVAISTLAIFVAIGYTIDIENYSTLFGINPFAIIVAMLISMFYYDSYSENFQSKLNKSFLNFVPISMSCKYFSFYILELFGVKAPTIIILIASLVVHNYFSDFLKIHQFFNLLAFVIVVYFIINNLALVMKLIGRNENKIKSYFMNYITISLILLLSWKFEVLFDTIEKNYFVAIVSALLLLEIINQLFYILFKKIMTSGYLLKK